MSGLSDCRDLLELMEDAGEKLGDPLSILDGNSGLAIWLMTPLLGVRPDKGVLEVHGVGLGEDD